MTSANLPDRRSESLRQWIGARLNFFRPEEACVIETIVPSDEKHWLELRAQDVTSTEVAALFGISPYLTEFELWHRHRESAVLEFQPTERTKWGQRLQDAIATGIAEDEGWQIRRMTEYMRDPEFRMGASFDFAIGKEGFLEVKNVDFLAFRDGWIEQDDDVEAPPHIELQIQQQFAMSKRKFAYIGALVGGNRRVLIKREPDSKIIDKIRTRTLEFWTSIAQNKEPKPNFARDADVIAKLCGYADPSKIFDARSDKNIAALASQYRDIGEVIKKLETDRSALKAEILMTIGDSAKVIGNDFSISSGVIAPSRVEAFERKEYRSFRINWKKAKETA